MKPLILFLDDDRYEMLGLVERLEAAGYSVTCFTRREEAEERLTNGLRPDLIISDLLMASNPADPGANRYVGVSFCRRVREVLRLTCPIVVLTVVVGPQVHEDVLKYADELLIKPVTPSELLARIQDVLERR